ncbi:MAG: hypothetical protein KME03_14295 [Aphanocapsa lilacina HA4352-LM1]|jgi:hypothetical protein|nr:hypothetical protein [Aphanocapsa lilacina HA4352-LM1]
MDVALKTVLDKARQSALRALRTEVAALGDRLVVRATLVLADQEFSAHAPCENIADVGRAEEQAILRACAFAGLESGRLLAVVPAPAPPAPAPPPAARPGLFDNSGPLYPEPDIEPAAPFEEEPPEAAGEPFDRDALMTESLSLMSAIDMDAKAGRNHLVQTYGKRSRNELSDEELLSFVEYLRAQNHANLTKRLPF